MIWKHLNLCYTCIRKLSCKSGLFWLSGSWCKSGLFWPSGSGEQAVLKWPLPYFWNYFPFEKDLPFIWTTFNSLYPRMICTKSEWYWPIEFCWKKRDFKISAYNVFYSPTIIFPWRRVFPFIWTNVLFNYHFYIHFNTKPPLTLH
jgi:hypothetical protein